MLLEFLCDTKPEKRNSRACTSNLFVQALGVAYSKQGATNSVRFNGAAALTMDFHRVHWCRSVQFSQTHTIVEKMLKQSLAMLF